LKLLQALQERGVLQLVIALFNRGDKVLAKLMDVLADETATNLLQSGITMMEGLSNIDAKAISRSFNGVKSGLENVGKSPDASEKRKPLGMFALMKQLKDPDVNAAISFGLDFMKGVGHAIRTGDNSPSKNQQ
jgi:uncharacterized protein YjgD (DUF1641 family)